MVSAAKEGSNMLIFLILVSYNASVGLVTFSAWSVLRPVYFDKIGIFTHP